MTADDARELMQSEPYNQPIPDEADVMAVLLAQIRHVQFCNGSFESFTIERSDKNGWRWACRSEDIMSGYDEHGEGTTLHEALSRSSEMGTCQCDTCSERK